MNHEVIFCGVTKKSCTVRSSICQEQAGHECVQPSAGVQPAAGEKCEGFGML